MRSQTHPHARAFTLIEMLVVIVIVSIVLAVSVVSIGEMTKDELFVSAKAAKAGVTVVNKSDTENLVMLKHFGPGNPDAAGFIRQ